MAGKVQIPGVLQDAPEGVKESYRSLANDNQRMFAIQYAVDRNGTQAAIRSGYAERSAHVRASELIKDHKVKAVYGWLMEQEIKKLEIDSESVLQAVAETAYSNIQDFFEEDEHGNIQPIPVTRLPRQVAAAIKKIKITSTTRGQGDNAVTDQKFEFELYDRQKGAELLGKHLKLWTELYEHMGDNPEKEDLKEAAAVLQEFGLDEAIFNHITSNMLQ